MSDFLEDEEVKKILGTFAITALSATVIAGPVNQLGNAGFEDPFVADGPPFAGTWEPFNGGGSGASFSVQGTVGPRTDLAHLQIGIDNDDNAFAGAFQDVEGLTAGDIATFSGWHATPSNPLDVGVEFRIEWRDSGTDSEISRTPNQTLAPTGMAYTEFSLTDTVPAGADTARVVYAIQTFGGDGPSNNGEVWVDDASFTVIPEPASFALLALAGLALRRR